MVHGFGPINLWHILLIYPFFFALVLLHLVEELVFGLAKRLAFWAPKDKEIRLLK